MSLEFMYFVKRANSTPKISYDSHCVWHENIEQPVVGVHSIYSIYYVLHGELSINIYSNDGFNRNINRYALTRYSK